MTKDKISKKNLRRSALFLAVAVVLLVGTTFAWFTDSVSTGVNKIQAGNLDMTVSTSADCTSWAEMTDTTNVFKDALWEPGHTEVAYVKVENAGSLAFKYQLGINIASEKTGINVAGETFKLSDYIEYDVVKLTSATEYADRAAAMAAVTGAQKIKNEFVEEAKLNAGDDADVYAIIVYMPETVGNEANYRGKDVPEIMLGISVNATQDTVEEDSFNNQYDKDANYEVASGKTFTSGTHVLKTGIKATAAGEQAVTASGADTEVTIDGGSFDGGENGNNVCIWAKEGAKVIINDGEFTVGKDASGTGNSVVYATGGATVEINGGFFYTDYAWNNFYYVLNKNNGNPGNFVVKGGTFVNYDPSRGDDNLGGNFVAAGYKVVSEIQTNEDVWYTVVEDTTTP